MTPEEDALRRVVQLLDRHQIPYMVTGSVASSFHGRPRSTHDTDIVIDPIGPRLDAFVADLASIGFYVDPAGARRALAERRQFNAIEMQSACKIDLIIKKARPFSREEFERRQRVDLAFAPDIAVATAETPCCRTWNGPHWAASPSDSSATSRASSR